jgi:tRNA uridine 5-carboxymethylaminomethyl modification enzyme
LTSIGYACGLISEDRYQAFLNKKEAEETEKARLEATHLGPDAVNPLLDRLELERVKSGVSLGDLLRRPQITYADLTPIDLRRPGLPDEVIKTVETDVKYAGYIKRELAEVERQKQLENKFIPEDMDYRKIKGLRLEAGQKLAQFRPATVGQASRISGVSPADVSVLLMYLGIK